MNKNLLAVAVSAALATPMAAQAITFDVSGNVSRMISFVDDGVSSDVINSDNAARASRFRFRGSEALGVGGMKAGFTIELGNYSNGSNRVRVNAQNGTGTLEDDDIEIRHSFIWFSGKWGRINLGQTSSAYDGTDGSDLGEPVSLSGVSAAITGFQHFGVNFRNGTTGAAVAPISAVWSTMDGGREDNLRYDTPKFGPFSGRVSVGDNGMWGFRLHANGAFSGAKYDVRGGYEDDEQSSGRQQWGMSGSLLFSQGTSITAAYAERDIFGVTGTQGNGVGAGTQTVSTFGNKVRDAEHVYFKLAHQWGNNIVGIDYVQVDDLAQGNDEYTSWGIGFGHTLPGPKVDLFAGYRNHDLDRPGTNVEDIDTFQMGARLRF